MSTILDALKKSEQQRQQQQRQQQDQPAGQQPSSSPDWLMADAPASGRSPMMFGLLAGALLVVLSLLIYQQLQPESAVPQSNGQQAVDHSTQPPRPVIAESEVVQETQVTVVAPPLVAETEAVATADTGTPSPVVVPPASLQTAPAPAIQSGTQVQRSEAVVRAERVLPPLDELRKVPDLIITGHIYSSVADKRSVSMNGREWQEGEYITAEVRLTDITQDGIVIDINGWRLPVKRNKGWQAIAGH